MTLPADSVDPRGRLLEIGRWATETLLEDCLPFWIEHAYEPFREESGFCFSLGRRGEVLDTDRAVWPCARFVWLLSTLARERPEAAERARWIEAAEHGIAFLREHAHDPSDGRYFFVTTESGEPLRKRRYVYTEIFACMAFASFGALREDQAARNEALRLWDAVEALQTDAALPPKCTEARPMRGLGMPMIRLGASQVLRDAGLESSPGLGELEACAQAWADELQDFVRPDLDCVLEVLHADGRPMDGFEGRCLNPGHAIEAAVFLFQEAQRLDAGADDGARAARCSALRQRAHTIFELSWKRAWDAEHGGMLYFVDRDGKPSTEYWHDMKFWWPHCESMLACLLAYESRPDPCFLERFDRIRSWCLAHFADPEHGEWFGYLHRDGSVSTELKGNTWKGPFHLPRALHACAQVVARITN